MKPYDSFHGGALDSVSMTSGNLFFHKTEYATAQRGQVQLTLSLQYNNKGFQLQQACSPPPHSTCNYIWQFVGNGMTLTSDQTVRTSSKHVDTGYNDGTGGNGTGTEIWVDTYSAQTADGSVHQLADTGNGYRSIDGSGLRWNGSATSAQDRSGMTVSLAGTSLDLNGSFTSADSSGNWVDTLGRTIPAIPGPTLATQTPSASTANLSSCPNLNLPYQPVTYAYSWNPPGPTGTSPLILCFASVYIRTAFWGSYQNGPRLFDVHQSTTMLQSVVRPDGTAWTFAYDAAHPDDTTSIGYGDLLTIGFPMGGSIAYTYATEMPYQGQFTSGMMTTESRSVITRSVDANDSTGPHTWNYNWANVITNTTSSYVMENTVTDPLGNDTVHQITGLYAGPSLFETQTRYYEGSKTSGTLLKTVNTDYSYSSNPFDQLGASPGPPTAINVVPIRVTTVLSNGLTSKEETDHDSGFTFRHPLWGTPVYPPIGQTSMTYPGTLGTVSARREYDYGSGGAGNLLRQTFTTYLWQGNSSYLNANMLDMPGSVVIQDGSGNRVAETDYSYDESAYLTSSGVTTQHGAAPNSVRGNLTTVSKWLNTSTNPVVTHTNWYDTGEVYKSIDALGNATTHSYHAAYAGAYSTMTCNALNQCVSGTYDFNSGLLTSFTDQNGAFQASGNTPGDFHNTSTYAYDNMLRMTKAVGPPDFNFNYPETDFNYLSTTTVQRKKKQDTNNNWITDYAYFDGLGRTRQTQLVDPDARGDDFVDTTYDAAGRISTVSNPHRSSSSSTDGITTTSYDPLGRVTKVTKPDGSSSTVLYSDNCVTATDEAGKSRKSCSDSLGRVTSVWEDSFGLNFETDYQYDTLGNLSRVDQKGSAPLNSLQWRIRLFTYDSLSRLLTAYNPESGMTNYSYDANGNLLQKTSPAPNQTGTATQSISYCYDALNRLTGKAYSAQTCSNGQLPSGTAVATYIYDSAAPAGWQLTNYIGRLVSDVTYDRPNGTMRSQNIYDYDSMGRTFIVEQGCGGGDCSDPPSSFAQYTYNLAGEVTSLRAWEASIYDVTYNYSYNTAGQPTLMTSSLSDAQHPGTLVSNISYNPAGSIEKMTYGNGLTGTNVFNNRLQPCRTSVNSSGATLQNCTDGFPAGAMQDFSYSYNSGVSNNGNVISMIQYLPVALNASMFSQSGFASGDYYSSQIADGITGCCGWATDHEAAGLGYKSIWAPATRRQLPESGFMPQLPAMPETIVSSIRTTPPVGARQRAASCPTMRDGTGSRGRAWERTVIGVYT